MSRRSLGGSLCVLGLIMASVALSCFWMQYTVLSPERMVRATETALDSPEVQEVLAERLAGSLAERLPGNLVSGEQANSVVRTVLATPEARSDVADALVASHQYSLGNAQEPPLLEGPAITQAVTSALTPLNPTLASSVATQGVSVPLPVRVIPGAEALQSGIVWLQGTTLSLAFLFLGLGFLIHPRRYVLARLSSWWLVTMSVLPVIFLWALPTVFLPTLGSWTSILAAAILLELGASIIPVLILMLVLGVGGVVVARFWKLASDRHRSSRR